MYQIIKKSTNNAVVTFHHIYSFMKYLSWPPSSTCSKSALFFKCHLLTLFIDHLSPNFLPFFLHLTNNRPCSESLLWPLSLSRMFFTECSSHISFPLFTSFKNILQRSLFLTQYINLKISYHTIDFPALYNLPQALSQYLCEFVYKF